MILIRRELKCDLTRFSVHFIAHRDKISVCTVAWVTPTSFINKQTSRSAYSNVHENRKAILCVEEKYDMKPEVRTVQTETDAVRGHGVKVKENI
jgi:hypothetical protein